MFSKDVQEWLDTQGDVTLPLDHPDRHVDKEACAAAFDHVVNQVSMKPIKKKAPLDTTICNADRSRALNIRRSLLNQ